MASNKVYEVLNTIRDQNALQQDFVEICDAARDKLREKYVDKLCDGLRAQHAGTRENPPREVQLLEACKAFLPAERHEAVDQLSGMFLTMDTCKRMSGQYAALSAQARPSAGMVRTAQVDPSVHSDGVYDVDSQCARRQSRGNQAIPQRQQPMQPLRMAQSPMAALMLLLMASSHQGMEL